jgi:hypothetical protein
MKDLSEQVTERVAVLELPVVREVEAIKIAVMKKKHYEQLPVMGGEIIHEEHGILGLVGAERPESGDGWLVIESGGRLVKCSLIRYLEAKMRADESIPFEARDQYYRQAAALVIKSVPQLFTD